ncbi:MAG TPA: DUF6786 family protein [Terriglobia bacterium]|nr:DUF6786 family protein [Terriglobia bacterium]
MEQSGVQIMREELVETLREAGKPTEVFQSSDGSTALILPYGARILGLFSPGSQENFYWTHPALDSPETARAFYAGEQWHNSGGDRTWLAPEIDFFFPDFPSLDRYWQQRELDPGHYQVVRKDGGLELVNEFSATVSRTKQQVAMRLSKALNPAPNPLRYEPGFKEIQDIEYAGYTLHTRLELIGKSKDDAVRVGLWNLLQMPHGGELWVPTYQRAEARVIMGSVSPEDLVVTDHLLRYKMRAAGEHKIGIRGVATTGRVGYVYETGGHSALIVRNFFVNPSGEYVDVPWDELSNQGFSTQACNIHSQLGSFSELEYHVPAIGSGTGLHRCHDVSQVWAYRGSQKQIQRVTSSLLAPEA